MARIGRAHNARSIAIWPGQTEDEATGVSLSATAYSNPVPGPLRTGHFACMLDVSAGVTGTFTVQYTLVRNPELTTDVDWVTDTTVTVIGDALALAGSAAKLIVFAGNVLPEWWRIKYTHTSGGPSTIRAYGRVDGDR